MSPNEIWIWNDDRPDVVKGTWCHVRLYETDTKYIHTDLVDKLKGYAVHDKFCPAVCGPLFIGTNGSHSSTDCTCGLTEVLKEMGE